MPLFEAAFAFLPGKIFVTQSAFSTLPASSPLALSSVYR